MERERPDAAQLLSKARSQLTELSESLQDVVDPAKISSAAKIPYKLLCFREALLWRTEEIARTALVCLERKELAAGGLLARGVAESAAAAWYLKTTVERQIKNFAAAELDKSAMALLLGGRSEDAVNAGAPSAINILSMIDKMDRDIPGFRKAYDAMSETAHPNWRGTAGLFSKIDRDLILTRFGANIRNVDFFEVQALGLLVFSLRTFKAAYNRVSELMPEFVDACESSLPKDEPALPIDEQ